MLPVVMGRRWPAPMVATRKRSDLAKTILNTPQESANMLAIQTWFGCKRGSAEVGVLCPPLRLVILKVVIYLELCIVAMVM